MLEELPDDMKFRLGYRIAYGEAARLAEMATFDHGSGGDFAAAVGGSPRESTPSWSGWRSGI
jgi:hypothetical protein